MIAVVVLLAVSSTAHAQSIAFVNVNVLPMDRERIESDRTVVVRGDRIVAVGAAADTRVPPDATTIDGAGRYLLPGLVDADVHLLGFGPGPRENFADGPLYLANGITTVVNLGGPSSPRRVMELDWKRRVEAGTMVGPTIYTAGAFVNEPRVTTPDEVERDVRAQARDGYDIIKYHELDDTTTGLSLASYRRMIETARELGMPLVGHAPNYLGVDAMLEARQPLAHIGNLSNIYFLPLASHRGYLLITATAFFVLIATAALSGAPRFSRPVVLATFAALVSLGSFLPGGPMFGSVALRAIFTALTTVVALASIASLVRTGRLSRDGRAPASTMIRAAVASFASAMLAVVLATFWTPIAWRSTSGGIDALAKRLHDAGITVQSTLVVYEAIGLGNPFYRLPAFNMKVAGALHRAGVTLIAGTDARGIPQLAPATSLHRELQLLRESGLSPYEAIRAATVAPAAFLGKDTEFGTITVGRRADLLLADRNPFQDLSTLKTPVGVMARGRWYPRGQPVHE